MIIVFTPEERQSVIRLVVDQEVLYAYALRWGLDKEPVVERLLSQIVAFVAKNLHEVKSTKELANEALLLGLNEGDLVVRLLASHWCQKGTFHRRRVQPGAISSSYSQWKKFVGHHLVVA